jgi:hypothetical protein
MLPSFMEDSPQLTFHLRPLPCIHQRWVQPRYLLSQGELVQEPQEPREDLADHQEVAQVVQEAGEVQVSVEEEVGPSGHLEAVVVDHQEVALDHQEEVAFHQEVGHHQCQQELHLLHPHQEAAEEEEEDFLLPMTYQPSCPN